MSTRLSFALPRVPSVPQPGTGTLRVGAGLVRFVLPVGYAMAGYSRVGRVAQGYASTVLAARALVVENPDGGRVGLVVLDAWASSNVLLHAVAAETAALGLGWERLLLAGTHIHTGAGHFFGDSLYDTFAQKDAGFAPELARALVRAVVGALTDAVDTLAPGLVGVVRTPLWGVASNRSLPAFLATPEAGLWHHAGHPGESLPDDPTLQPEHAAIDPRVVTVVATDLERRPRAVFATFGCHATALGAEGTVYDSDWPGRAASLVGVRLHEGQSGLVVAVAASAAGDVSPLEYSGGEPLPARLGTDRALAVAEAVATAVLAAVPAACAAATDVPAKVCAGEWVPEKPVGAVAPLVKWMYGKPVLYGSEESRTAMGLFGKPYHEGNPKPDDGGPQAGKRPVNAVDEVALLARIKDLAPPETAPVHLLELAGHRFLAVPGEPTVAFAARLVRVLGGPPTTVMHCGGAYHGYFTTPEEFVLQHYEGASTLHGRHTFEHLSATCAAVAGGAALPTGPVHFETVLRHGSTTADGAWLGLPAPVGLESMPAAPVTTPPSMVYAARAGERLLVGWVTDGPNGPDVPLLAVYGADGMRLEDVSFALVVAAMPGRGASWQWTAETTLPADADPALVAVLPSATWGPFGVLLPSGALRVPACDAAALTAALAGVAPPTAALDLLAPWLTAQRPELEAAILGYRLDGEAEREKLRVAFDHGFDFPGLELARIPIDPASTAVQTAPWLPWAPDAAPFLWLGLGLPMPGFRRPGAYASRFCYALPSPRPDGSRCFALTSDFASGEYHSRYIAKQMEAIGPDAVFHLGDVYYGGTDDEVRRGLVVPLAEDTRLLLDRPFWALPGNHELYSRGGPNRDWGGAWLTFLDTNREAGRQAQEGSSFALDGDGLAIIAVDTDWLGTGRLDDTEMRGWLTERLHAARAAGRLTVLLTQNNPWDLHVRMPTRLWRDDLHGVVEAGLVDFWFFGNVHYGALYDSTAERPVVASCIGHGGYASARVRGGPEWRAPQPVRWVEQAPRFPPWTDVRQDRSNNGFCRFDLRPDGSVVLRYVDWMGNLRAEATCARKDGRMQVVAFDSFDLPDGPG